MTSELSIFAARLREQIGFWSEERDSIDASNPDWAHHADSEFNGFAVLLFALQFKHNAAYQRICEAQSIHTDAISHWTEIPIVPTAAFKELELTSLPPEQRTQVFHSSGTTEQRPSRHFHNAESLALYEASLWPWFVENCRLPIADGRLVSLTPPASQTPRSSLVHMLDLVRQKMGEHQSIFVGRAGEDGSWTVDFDSAFAALSEPDGRPRLVLGTAFSFVHLLDTLVQQDLKFNLPPGSRVLETGGYKGRSRTMSKDELHRLITDRLGVPAQNIICEYGMSELSSQAYDSPWAKVQSSKANRIFRLPPWARARVISPENGREVADGETGLLQVFDLANVFSVMAIQTEDLVVRRGDGFELIGRAQLAEPRGCSLMTA